jgi:hypothetical protein
MPETCTCGAQLPPDAVFCHKCGKPQREILAVEVEAPAPAPAWQPPAPVMEPQEPPARVSFRNPEALRTALLAAVLATFLLFLSFFTWIGAGFFAVSLYRRRTGRSMDVGSCVRMGWLTGLLTFAIPAVLFTAMVLLLHASGGMDTLKTMVQSAKDPEVQKMWETMQSAPQMAAAMLRFFVFTTFFSMAGGLLGAGLAGRANPRPPGGNTV